MRDCSGRRAVNAKAIHRIDCQHTVAHMGFPKAHWCKIHSTNPIERLNAEIKRRTDIVGIFPNEAAIYRLVGALLLELNAEWALQRRYIMLETLAEVGGNPTVSLSAVAVRLAIQPDRSP
jgi:putative transposase